MRRMPFKISDQEIIDIYLRTKSLKQTALAAQGITGTQTVAKKLRSLGVNVRNYKLKPIQISDAELIKLYASGKSLMEIATISSGSKGAMAVRKRLHELGIDTSYSSNTQKYKHKMSSAFHKYTLDENIFDAMDTEEKAYWFGFLMADGYNHVDRTVVTLRLQSQDREVLEKFKAFLKTDAPISTYKRATRTNHLEKEYCEVRACSVHLSKQLEAMGFVQAKTYVIEYPKHIPEELTRHFIRGYFDGNGCVYIGKRKDRKKAGSLSYQCTLVGRGEFIQEVQKKIVNNTGVSLLPLKSQSDNYAKTMHYGGYNVVLKILNYMYKDATIYLKRKFDKYKIMVTRQSNL